MRRFLLVLCLLAPVLIVLAIGWSIHRTWENAKAAYAIQWATGMVIDHLRENDNRWPAGWDDLQVAYENEVSRIGSSPWAFQDIHDRVAVDFSVDPMDLVRTIRSGQSLRRVVWLRNGSTTHWEGEEPNRVIADYLSSAHKP